MLENTAFVTIPALVLRLPDGSGPFEVIPPDSDGKLPGKHVPESEVESLVQEIAATAVTVPDRETVDAIFRSMGTLRDLTRAVVVLLAFTFALTGKAQNAPAPGITLRNHNPHVKTMLRLTASSTVFNVEPTTDPTGAVDSIRFRTLLGRHCELLLSNTSLIIRRDRFRLHRAPLNHDGRFDERTGIMLPDSTGKVVFVALPPACLAVDRLP